MITIYVRFCASCFGLYGRHSVVCERIEWFSLEEPSTLPRKEGQRSQPGAVPFRWSRKRSHESIWDSLQP
ncbi:hypothetical protein GWI33_011751 [Rhynchophorus ferrugineus]|uniref:Uncharacterized protein n=1 Tax=Rhynchophorus ferrugineus TaxID=354439 RepID=A0A834ICC7_RHYFE|nr:hypothetical protein GWI33_011751 [Rhynchophorus ferrugineus]